MQKAVTQEVFLAYVRGKRFLSADDKPTMEDCEDRFMGVFGSMEDFYTRFTGEKVVSLEGLHYWYTDVFYAVPAETGDFVFIFATY